MPKGKKFRQPGIPVPEQAGDRCYFCGTPVIEKCHPENWKPKPNQPYYYIKWLKCPKKKCTAIWHKDKWRQFTTRRSDIWTRLDYAISKDE